MPLTRRHPVERDPRWTAVQTRDRQADGAFWYSVRTTGVYCRPSCAARRPRPEHVRFHPSPGEAEREGFRPCRRCRPDEAPAAARQTTLVAEACRRIARAEDLPGLAALAREAGLSPHYFHRVFRRITGLTPRAYAAAHRAGRLRDALGRGGRVTDAIYASGFNSTGRFYASAADALGMRPSAYRDGGAQTEIRFAAGQSALGVVLVARTAKGVCAIFMGEDPDALVRDLQNRFPRATLVAGDRAFERTVAQVVACVEAPHRAFDLPLDVRGTAFQLRVWEALRRIPPGTTASYAEIAARIGSPSAVRAVAQACAANPVAVAIPCHRVVRTDGALSGYRWGVERKRRLLEREAEGTTGDVVRRRRSRA